MKKTTTLSLLLALAISACGGGTDPNDPCIGVSYKDHPECVPPIPLPCTYPCSAPSNPGG